VRNAVVIQEQEWHALVHFEKDAANGLSGRRFVHHYCHQLLESGDCVLEEILDKVRLHECHVSQRHSHLLAPATAQVGSKHLHKLLLVCSKVGGEGQELVNQELKDGANHISNRIKVVGEQRKKLFGECGHERCLAKSHHLLLLFRALLNDLLRELGQVVFAHLASFTLNLFIRELVRLLHDEDDLFECRDLLNIIKHYTTRLEEVFV